MVCNQRFKRFFTEEEMRNTPSLVEVIKPKKICDRDEQITDYFNVKLMVASIAARMIMKKYIGRYDVRRVFTKYYSVLSQYSFKRVLSLIKVKPFQIVFQEFITSEDFQEMLESDDTLSKLKELYSEKANRLITIMQEFKKY